MALPAQHLSAIKNTESTNTIIKKGYSPELIFALCSPIGTNLKLVSKRLKDLLEKQFGYENCEIIKLSYFIQLLAKKNGYNYSIQNQKTSHYNGLMEPIQFGNELRDNFGNSILVEKAIEKILNKRNEEKKSAGGGHWPIKRKCYIIDSIKHPDELELLRITYRELFYFFGVFSPMSLRRDVLINNKGLSKEEANNIIQIDANDNFKHGQDVTHTFRDADFFIRLDKEYSEIDPEIIPDDFLTNSKFKNKNRNLVKKIESFDNKLLRYLDLILGTSVITPTPQETAMYYAYSAASNSACISRQVGASIVDENFQFISVGWNDVPKFGGNLYGTEIERNDEDDCRCYIKYGSCRNDKQKRLLTDQIVTDLVDNNVIKSSQKANAAKLIDKAGVDDITEYSRAVHAEMHAIIIGSHNTKLSMIKGKVFCTTFPCHNCARHILLAGISEVYFIEPYEKSMSYILHNDSITDDETNEEKLRIISFDGVSPNKYIPLFRTNSRKHKNGPNKGKLVEVLRKTAIPRSSMTLEAVYTLESYSYRKLDEKNLTNEKL